MAALLAPKAMVKVGPPLFCKRPRLSAAVFVRVDPDKVPEVSRVLVAVAVPLVPLTKSTLPPLLLAMMVLLMMAEPLL